MKWIRINYLLDLIPIILIQINHRLQTSIILVWMYRIITIKSQKMYSNYKKTSSSQVILATKIAATIISFQFTMKCKLPNLISNLMISWTHHIKISKKFFILQNYYLQIPPQFNIKILLKPNLQQRSLLLKVWNAQLHNLFKIVHSY